MHPPNTPRRLVAATIAVVTIILGVAVATPPTGSPRAAAIEVGPLVAVRYRPPTDAAVVDPFRPPETAYGPGNRGLEYATIAGQSIGASADGTVRFAGQVGTHSSVTIRHDDGVVTTYSMLTETRVTSGEVVTAATIIGVADTGFHFGAKRGEVYLDPAILLDASANGGERRAVLVPIPVPEDR